MEKQPKFFTRNPDSDIISKDAMLGIQPRLKEQIDISITGSTEN